METAKKETRTPIETTLQRVNLSTHKYDPKKFTGKAYAIIYMPHNGFADYAILEIDVEKGTIVQGTHSDPLVGVELQSKLDWLNGRRLEEMRRNYPEGYRHV